VSQILRSRAEIEETREETRCDRVDFQDTGKRSQGVSDKSEKEV
jgi:hypothetical protein